MRIGKDTLPQPAWPSTNPTITDLYGPNDGKGGIVEKGAYVFAKFAVVDWQPVFDSQN